MTAWSQEAEQRMEQLPRVLVGLPIGLDRIGLVTRLDFSIGVATYNKIAAAIRPGNEATGCPITVDFTEKGFYHSYIYSCPRYPMLILEYVELVAVASTLKLHSFTLSKRC